MKAPDPLDFLYLTFLILLIAFAINEYVYFCRVEVDFMYFLHKFSIFRFMEYALS